MPENKEQKAKVLEELAKHISLLNQKKLRALCVGPVNSGKTSFLDSINSALEGEISTRASKGFVAARKHDIRSKSSTEQFLMIRMACKQASGAVFDTNVFIGDMPGIQEIEGVQLENIKDIIQGNVKSGCKIMNNSEVNAQTKDQHKEDRVHCVCFVFDISMPPEDILDKQTDTIKLLQHWLREEEIPYVVILTKADLLNVAVAQNKTAVYEDRKVQQNKDKLIEKFNFKQNLMFPVINYKDEDEVVPESDALLLAAFFELLKQGRTYLRNMEKDDKITGNVLHVAT